MARRAQGNQAGKGTHLMIRIAEVTKGVYMGFIRRDEQAIIRNMSKAQTEFAGMETANQV